MTERNEIAYNQAVQELQLRFPTPQRVLDALKREEEAVNSFFENDGDGDSAEDSTDFDHSNEIEKIIIEENDLLSLITRHIFIHEFDEKAWHILTGVPDFLDQIHANGSLLYEARIIDTLIKNGIDTAKKYDDRIEAYFETLKLQDMDMYIELETDLLKFVGFETNEEIRLNFKETIVDEEDGDVFELDRSVLIFDKGVATENCLRRIRKSFGDESFEKICQAIKEHLSAAISAENYELAQLLQKQLNNL